MATKARAKKTVASAKVMVGRFGSDPVTVTVSGNATVGGVLESANINAGSNEKIWLNGARAVSTDKVKSGDIVSVVTPKQAGL